MLRRASFKHLESALTGAREPRMRYKMAGQTWSKSARKYNVGHECTNNFFLSQNYIYYQIYVYLDT